MKKILSLILSLTILLSSFSFTFAFAADVYEKPSNYDEMTGIITALNIADANFVNLNRNITRGEFTKLVVNASGLGEYVTANVLVPPFSDVAVDNEFAAYIEFAKSKKLAFGYSDGTFKPDENITLTEAVVYLTRLLGYQDVAEAKGGYPGGYQTLAYTIDLMKSIKISLDSFVSVNCAVNLIYNALNANVLMVDSFTSDSYTISAGNTLMYESFKILKAEGIVEGVDLTNLVGPNDVEPYNIKVNGALIDVGTLSPNTFLGYNVSAYYEVTEDANVLVYICEAKGKNNVVTIDINDVTSISDYSVNKIDDNGKQKSFEYMRGASIIYNGAATNANFNISIFNDEDGNKLQGELKLLDNNTDGIYDVIFVNAYEEYIVGKIDRTNNILYDANDFTKNIVLDVEVNDPYTVIYNMEGEEINIGKLKTNGSVLIYKSKDAYQGYIKAYFSEQKVTGAFTSFGYNESNKAICIIDDTEYELSTYAKDMKYEEKYLGKNVEALLNSLGQVVAIKDSNESSEKWALLRAVSIPDAEDETYTFHILNDSGVMESIPVAKYITLDGSSEKIKTDDEFAMNNLITRLINVAKVVNAFGYESEDEKAAEITNKKLDQLIRYRTNTDAKITYIDTAFTKDGARANKLNITDSDAVFFDTYAKTAADSAWVVSGAAHIGSKFYGDASTKAFLYNGEDKELYGVVPVTSIAPSLHQIEGYAFYSDLDSIYPTAFMAKNDGYADFDPTVSNNYGIVKKITTSVDEDGRPARKLYISRSNAVKEYICSDLSLLAMNSANIKDSSGNALVPGGFTLANLQIGDIITYASDYTSGKISQFELVLREVNGEHIAFALTNRIKGSHPGEFGFVFEVQNDGFIYVPYTADTLADYSSIGDYIEEKVETYTYKAAKLGMGAITIYEPDEIESKMIRAGSTSDMSSYSDFKDVIEESGDESIITKVFIHSYGGYNRPIDIFILK